jgi:Leucine-rich repeat (LRR) protein
LFLPTSSKLFAFNKQVKFTFAAGLNGLRRLHTLNLARNQLISTLGLGETPTIQQLDLSHNHLQEVLDIGKTTIFNGLLGNCPDVFCWASDYLIWSSFWSPE